MGAPNLLQQLYLKTALNESKDGMFDHPADLEEGGSTKLRSEGCCLYPEPLPEVSRWQDLCKFLAGSEVQAPVHTPSLVFIRSRFADFGPVIAKNARLMSFEAGQPPGYSNP